MSAPRIPRIPSIPLLPDCRLVVSNCAKLSVLPAGSGNWAQFAVLARDGVAEAWSCRGRGSPRAQRAIAARLGPSRKIAKCLT